jgi:hypothetical protein
MSRFLGPIIGGFLFLVGALGYIYYGPPHHTHFVTRTSLYRSYLGPGLDKILAEKGAEGISVGYLNRGIGELTFRSSSALVFKPAREGQRFFGGTVVSTGPKSGGSITLLDESIIELSENTTVILELPEVSDTGTVIDLQVISGTLSAEKKSSQAVQLKVSNQKTQTEVIKKEKIVMMSEPVSVSNEKNEAPISLVPKVSPVATVTTNTPVPSGLENLRSSVVSAPSPLDIPLQSQESLSLETGELSLEGSTEQSFVDREPTALPEPEPDWPEVILAREIPVVRKKKIVRVKEFEAPPELNDLSNALFALKKGKNQESQRYLAKSLTRPGYFKGSFNSASKFALDGILQNYIQNKECDLAYSVLENAQSVYSSSKEATDWIQGWKVRSIKSCGNL